MSSWEKQLEESLNVAAVIAQAPGTRSDDAALVPQLRDAAHRWNKRTDGFADGKASVCLDMADKVERFGSFASDKQRDYARKLIEWSKPRAAPAKIEMGLSVQRLFGVMQKHSHFHAEPLKLSRKNQDTLVWILWKGQCVGKIVEGRAELFTKRLGADRDAVESLLVEFDTNPLEAAKKYGKLSGRCCSCGRDLTDPESIEAGIGPVCATKF